MAVIMKKRKTENSNSFTPSKRPYNLPSHLEPSTATQVHALEALLRNPIKFIPATHETTQGQFTMAAPSTKQIATKAWKDGVDAKAARQRDSLRYLSRTWEHYIAAGNGMSSKGLDNPGPLCYRNVAMQMFMHVPVFLNWLEQYHHPNDCVRKKPCMACHLRHMKLVYWEEYRTTTLRNKAVQKAYEEFNASIASLGWDEPEDEQLDTRDFVLFIFQSLRGQLPATQWNALQAMFGFVTDSIAECSGCKMVYNLHSPPDPEMVFLIDLSQAKQNQPLEDLIYTNLNSTRSMKCHSGACTDTGEKACEEFISVPPEVLIISLNRFRMTKSKKPSIRKVSTKIDFKHRLDLARHYGHRGLDRNSELNYCLTSVIWHRGSLSSGHYMVTAKDPGVKDNTWRLFNDSTVSSVPRGQALDLPSDHPTQKWTAYVLTYLRCPDDKRESTKITSGSRALDQIRQAVEAAL